MGVVRVGSQLRVPCSGSGAARVPRVRGGGAALPPQATGAKINGGYVMWVARWCVSLLRVTDAMFAAVFEREAQVPQGELVVWPGPVHANWVVDRLLAIDPCFQLHRDVVQYPVSPGGVLLVGGGRARVRWRCGRRVHRRVGGRPRRRRPLGRMLLARALAVPALADAKVRALVHAATGVVEEA